MLLTLRSIWLGAGALIAGALAVGGLRNPASTGFAPPALTRRAPAATQPTPHPPVADSIVALGLRLRGVDYRSGGTTPEGGFDCSGFVRYCFAQRGVAVPPSSTLQAQVGREVSRAQARPGDIIIFAGTEPGSRSPGHTGIVISRPGEPLRFVHSSSARKVHGVKVSRMDSTRYEERLLSIRRVLEDGAVGGAVPAVAAVPPAPRPAPVAELDPVAVPIVVPEPEPAPRVVRAAKVSTRRTGSRTRSTRRHRTTAAPKHRTTARAAAPRSKTRAAAAKKKVTTKATAAKKAAVGKKAPARKKITTAKKAAPKKKVAAKPQR